MIMVSLVLSVYNDRIKNCLVSIFTLKSGTTIPKAYMAMPPGERPATRLRATENPQDTASRERRRVTSTITAPLVHWKRRLVTVVTAF